MTLLSLNPVKEFENLTHNLQRYFEDFPTFGNHFNTEFSPRIDITEKDGDIRVEAEIPGVKKEDLKITVKDNVLTIEGEKKREEEKEEKNYYRIERSYGVFSRSFVLPENVDTNNVEAKFKDGVLIVDLKKALPKKIEEKEIKVK